MSLVPSYRAVGVYGPVNKTAEPDQHPAQRPGFLLQFLDILFELRDSSLQSRHTMDSATLAVEVRATVPRTAQARPSYPVILSCRALAAVSRS